MLHVRSWLLMCQFLVGISPLSRLWFPPANVQAQVMGGAQPGAPNCTGEVPRIHDLAVGSGETATLKSKALIRLVSWKYSERAPDLRGSIIGSNSFVHDFPAMVAMGSRVQGTYSRSLMDAILARINASPMRVGGRRHVIYPCHQLVVEIELFEIANAPNQIHRSIKDLPPLSPEIESEITRSQAGGNQDPREAATAPGLPRSSNEPEKKHLESDLRSMDTPGKKNAHAEEGKGNQERAPQTRQQQPPDPAVSQNSDREPALPVAKGAIGPEFKRSMEASIESWNKASSTANLLDLNRIERAERTGGEMLPKEYPPIFYTRMLAAHKAADDAEVQAKSPIEKRAVSSLQLGLLLYEDSKKGDDSDPLSATLSKRSLQCIVEARADLQVPMPEGGRKMAAAATCHDPNYWGMKY